MERSRERGFSMVGLIATMAVMLVLMSVAVPSWRYVMKDMREEELIFRGKQIAEGIQRYQQKNGNALPTSLEVLVKGRYLRKAYTDPMSKDGKWRFFRPGEPIGVPTMPQPSTAPGRRPGGAAGTAPAGEASPSPLTSGFASPPPGPGGQTFGGITAVASRSTEKSLRVFSGRTRYSEWVFVPGQTKNIVIGKQVGPKMPGAPGVGSPGPGGFPTPPGSLPVPPPGDNTK